MQEPDDRSYAIRELKADEKVKLKQLLMDEGADYWFAVELDGLNGYIKADHARQMTQSEVEEWFKTPTPGPTHTPTPMLSPTPTPSPTLTPTPRPTLVPGGTWTMGRYELDGNIENGSENIVWRVLAIKDGKALLLSESVLAQMPLHSVKEKVSWGTCTLRDWLNGALFQTAFSETEKEAVCVVPLSNMVREGNPKNSSGGKDTEDRLFLLSYREAVAYFPTAEDRIAYAYDDDATAKPWWLRSIGESRRGAAVVREDGYCEGIRPVNNTEFYVRPAMWVDMEKLP